FAVIGIMLGVATLILVTSLMNGIATEMTSRFIGIDGHVTVYANARAFTDYETALAAIKPIPGIVSATPKVSGQGMATA
ncbi:ABC transporter permease, partial [Enterococcus gallinarum]|uniref:ABC transporter permease n=1 Tax=Enterococcus gallinarum TaxID=1353 RepID=UPI003D0AF98E